MHTVTCCHTLAGALQADAYKGACTHTHVIHTHTSCFPGGCGGQWDRASLRVWFVCLHLIIETGLFLQPLLHLFYILTRERRRERERSESGGEKKNKALTAFSHNGERLSHPLSAATVCRLSVQYNRRQRGRGKVSCIVSSLILV